MTTTPHNHIHLASVEEFDACWQRCRAVIDAGKGWDADMELDNLVDRCCFTLVQMVKDGPDAAERYEALWLRVMDAAFEEPENHTHRTVLQGMGKIAGAGHEHCSALREAAA